MLKKACLTVLTAALVLASSCPPNQGGGGGGGGSSLQPVQWPQVYANRENTGFNAVHSPPGRPILQKWVAPVGTLAFSSPVIGPDGVIYIGNAAGELVATNPDGSALWRTKLSQTILSSPAVNPDTNDVIVLAQEGVAAGATTINSRLFRVRSVEAPLLAQAQAIPGGGFAISNFQGQIQATSSQTVPSTAAPKIWNNFVFVGAKDAVFVFDATTLALVGIAGADSCFNLVCGDSGAFGDVYNFVACDVLLLDCPNPVPTPAAGPIVDASVALEDSASLVGDSNLPVLVVIGSQCANGFRFHPAGDAPQSSGSPNFDPHFELLWSFPLVEVTCENFAGGVRATTPVIALGGQVIFTTASNFGSQVYSLDLMTGTKNWSSAVVSTQAPPVVALRQLYFVNNQLLYIYDSNGALLTQQPLLGTGQNLAISDDFVYVTTTRGVHTFQPFPGLDRFFGAIDGNDTNTGTSYPILAADGTLYISSPDGFIHAYQQQGLVAFAQGPAPTVTWQSPTDGGTLPAAAGQSLVVNVAAGGGSAFNGTAGFVSDLDGDLCVNVPAGATATCVTTKPLTPGAQHLTALATDVAGATFSATITVQVTSQKPNTPPTAAITSPKAGGIFQTGAPINFNASITDPDQSTFPPASVQWTSNIDGNIGTGLSFSRTLSLGNHTITVTATDAAGATGTATVSIQVSAGPTVSITQPTNGSILFSGTPITFSATVSDSTEPTFPDSGIKWQSSIDGDLGTGASVSHALSNGDHTITCTATDSHGLTGKASISVSVSPPVQ